MAAAFYTAHRKEHVREQFGAVVTALREMLDAFVSNRMRRTAAEAAGQTNAIDRRPMIAVQLTSPDPSRPRELSRSAAASEREAERSAILPVEKAPTATTRFRALDAGIVNEAIPAFFIGRNKEGFWVVRDVNGRIGGIFLLENSALSFAQRNSRPAGCATIFPTERSELDLENNGNPLVTCLRPLLRLAMPHRRRAAAFIRKMAQAITRGFKDFYVP